MDILEWAVFGMIGGAGCGLIPIAIGFLRNNENLGKKGFAWCVGVGFLFGYKGSFPVALVFAIIILASKNKSEKIKKSNKDFEEGIDEIKNIANIDKADLITPQYGVFKNFLEKLRKFRLQDKLIIMGASTLILFWSCNLNSMDAIESIPFIVMLNLFLYWIFFGFGQTN